MSNQTLFKTERKNSLSPYSDRYYSGLNFSDRCDLCGGVELALDVQLCWQCVDKMPVYRASDYDGGGR